MINFRLRQNYDSPWHISLNILFFGRKPMKLTELFLSELESQAAATRKVLERVPEGRPEWVPHPKSMRLGYLSTLVATMPGWIDFMINKDELDLHPVGGAPAFKPQEFSTRQELLAALDASVAKARAALEGTTD